MCSEARYETLFAWLLSHKTHITLERVAESTFSSTLHITQTYLSDVTFSEAAEVLFTSVQCVEGTKWEGTRFLVISGMTGIHEEQECALCRTEQVCFSLRQRLYKWTQKRTSSSETETKLTIATYTKIILLLDYLKLCLLCVSLLLLSQFSFQRTSPFLCE